jgi:hypothetical protein
VDGLWLLVAVVVLRFLWRFNERAARSSSQDSGAKVEERKARREQRRARPLPPPRPGRLEPEAPPAAAPPWARTREGAEQRRPRQGATASPGPMPRAALTLQDALLERLRQAVEAAGGATPEPPPPPPPRVQVPPPPQIVEPVTAVEPAREPTTEQPALRHGSMRLRDLQAMLHHRATVRDALLLREILGPPVARRRGAPPLHAR